MRLKTLTAMIGSAAIAAPAALTDAATTYPIDVPFIQAAIFVLFGKDVMDVTNKPEMLVMQDETFGPLLPIIKVKDADEALRLALLLSAIVSGLLLGASLLVVWVGRRRNQAGL